ncbi:MAG: hypothetical protein ACE5KW_01050 [Dehalococcoidia bacterium]
MARVGAAALGLALLGLVFGACKGGSADDGIVITVTSTSTPSPTPTAIPTPTPKPTPVPNVCGFNPDAATEAELQVQQPRALARPKSPFHVRGWGSTIAKTGVAVAIVDDQAQVLEIRDVSALPREGQIPPPGLNVTDTAAPFAVDMAHPVETAQPVCLWVFQRGPGGVETNVVQVPLLLNP